MKLKTILVCLVLTFCLYSCNENKTSKDTNETEKIEDDKELFKVTLSAIVTKDDSFQLYYMDDDSQPFDENKSFFIDIKGSPVSQDIVFKLPKDELPNFLRIDFGVNKEQSDIVITNFKINYFDKIFEAKGSSFFNYFVVNEQTITKDVANSSLKPKILENGNYDPITYSELGLYEEIQKIIK
ncbi:hypothetical protein [Flavobacterium tegetincola]|uniref:hypothetical protein n=1 Tax=Flavobacterium tegetincola TaxID=150172 RepID=UPI0004060AA1|nr:hypothetical protein [Flavobacterium tegetincola]